MNTFRSIVVGVDFTPCSLAALREAMRIAQFSGGQVHPLHVVDTQIALEMQSALNQMQEDIRRGLLFEVQQQWKDVVATIPEASTLQLEASVEHRILGLLRHAREAKADLIVLGAFGTQHPEVGAGTVATSCVRNATQDVLLVRDTHNGPFKKVVVAIDFSETSRRALALGAQIALTDGAPLFAVHVYSQPWDRYHYREETPHSDPKFLERYRHLLEQKLSDFCAEVKRDHPALNLTCEVSDAGRHRSGIVAFSERLGADLICLGSRGQSNLRDFFLGSTAEKVLANSKCSVLAVKPGRE